MADDIGDRDKNDDTGGAGREPDPRTPLWVKLFAGIALAVVVLFVVLLLLDRGHGPGRHAVFGGHAPPSDVTDARPRL